MCAFCQHTRWAPFPPIVERGSRTRRGVERPGPEQLPGLQVPDDLGVDPRQQLSRRGEPAASHARLHPGDERVHLRVTLVGLRSLDEDEPMPVQLDGAVELAPQAANEDLDGGS